DVCSSDLPGQQGRPVGEVSGGGGMGHPQAAGDGADGERGNALFFGHRDGRGNDRGAQVAVVVGIGLDHSASVRDLVDTDNIDCYVVAVNKIGRAHV